MRIKVRVWYSENITYFSFFTGRLLLISCAKSNAESTASCPSCRSTCKTVIIIIACIIVRINLLLMIHFIKILLFSLQVLAVVILLVSAGTIGIIVNNEALDRVRTTSSSELSDAGLQLQVLILRSLGSAGWLILLAVGVGIAEIVAILLRVTFNTEAYKLALGVIVSALGLIYNLMCLFHWGSLAF